ncbi:DNAJC11 domain-containing protein [Novipirellula caenicola]|uniref:DnaJ-like protein C11 C-terminal domain-containing protein n=1 Tax=Novipirellula caenicola TaxID=1536901 RepID=A0ABP9VJA4_9BACT
MRLLVTCLCGLVLANAVLAEMPATQKSLEIIEARFGASNQWVDLTEKLQAQVTNGQLHLKSLKPILEGIQTPRIGREKTLAVVYRYQGQVQLKMVASNGAASDWGTLVLPEPEELSRFRVRMYLDNPKQPLLERTIAVNQRFAFKANHDVSLSGQLRRDDSGTLHFEGTATHPHGSSQFDANVTIAETLPTSGGTLSGGLQNFWVQFDRPSAETAVKNKTARTKQKRSPAVRQAVQRYEASLLQASREFKQQSESASESLMRDLEKIRASTSATDHFHVVAAFYGQNVSWIEVTDKVRKAVGKKRSWTADVRTETWGEPAPGFGGPRTLLVAYFADGELKFKSVYQGNRITLP